MVEVIFTLLLPIVKQERSSECVQSLMKFCKQFSLSDDNEPPLPPHSLSHSNDDRRTIKFFYFAPQHWRQQKSYSYRIN